MKKEKFLKKIVGKTEKILKENMPNADDFNVKADKKNCAVKVFVADGAVKKVYDVSAEYSMLKKAKEMGITKEHVDASRVITNLSGMIASDAVRLGALSVPVMEAVQNERNNRQFPPQTRENNDIDHENDEPDEEEDEEYEDDEPDEEYE